MKHSRIFMILWLLVLTFIGEILFVARHYQKATAPAPVYIGCSTDYECEQTELTEQAREIYYETEKTY